MNLTNLTDLGLTAFIDHRHPKGILVLPLKCVSQLELTDNPICTCSGDHKIVVFGGDGPVKS
jgi:hypothetical protein